MKRPSTLRLSTSAVLGLAAFTALLGSVIAARSTARPADMTASAPPPTKPLRASARRSGEHRQPAIMTTAAGVTFNVNIFTDSHATNLTTGTDAGGKISLRSALEAAETQASTQASPHVINLPAGSYTLTLGELAVGNATNLSTNIVGQGTAANTTITQTKAGSRVFDVNFNSAPNVTCSISNVKITGGTDTSGDFSGAGILYGGPGNKLTITNCDISGNDSSHGNGGGIFASQGDLTVTGTTFSNNSASRSGGGIYFDVNGTASTLTVTNCAFTSNTSKSVSDGGGAIYSFSTTATISQSTFSGNKADNTGVSNNSPNGAAIFSAFGTTTITTSSFSGNQVIGPGHAGAIDCNGGTVNVSFCRFAGNTAATPAKGKTLYRNLGGTLTANNNWWGVNTGPGANDVTAASGSVTINNWLQLRHSANPASINSNSASTLTADIFGRSDNTAVAASNLTGLPAFPNSAATVFSNAVSGALSGAGTQFVNGSATATFTAAVGCSGGADATIDNQTVTATLTINNQPPGVTASSGSMSYLENQAATAIDPGLTVTAAAGLNLVSATVAITTNFASNQDVLGFTDQLGITGSYSNGVLTLTGSTTTQNYETALRTVTYFNSSCNPSANARTVTFTVNTGCSTNNLGSATRNVTVTPINTAPTLDAINPVVLLANAGSQTVNLTGISAGCGESQTLTITAASSNTTLIPNPTVTYTSPNATGSLSFTPVANQIGSAVVTVTVTDNGGTANGGVDTFSRTFNVSVTVPQAAGLTAWYRAENNFNDSKGSNHGTGVNSPAFTAGKVGQSFSFTDNGNSSPYVQLPSAVFPYPSSGTGTTPFSIELWFKTPANGSGGVILGQQDSAPFSTPGGWIPAIYVGTAASGGKLHASLFFHGSAFNPLISSQAVNDGNWHHFAGTYDGTTERAYLDGVQMGSLAHAQQSYGSGSYQYQLGTGYTSNGWPDVPGGWFSFTGQIDEVSIYNRALGDTEVQAIFQTNGGGKSTTAIAPTLSLAPVSQMIPVGVTRSLTVTLSAAQSTSTNVALTSANSGLVSVPATVTIPANQISASFNATGLASGGAVTITASLPTSLGGGSATASVTPFTCPTVSVTASSNPSSAGQAVTFTATLSINTASGVVQFKDNGVNLGAAASLTGGVATLTTSALAVGRHTITADYSGDGNVCASTSPGLTQIVETGSCATLPNGILSWWRAENNANDTSGTNHGVMQLSAAFAPGWVGQAFSFDGTHGYVKLPDNFFPFPASGTGQAPFTFEVWFKTTSGGVILGQQVVDPYNNTGGYVPGLYVGIDGQLYAELFWKGDHNALVSGATVNDGFFHHVAVVYDGTNQTLYLDGALSGSQSHTQSGYSTSYKYQLGTGNTAGWPGGNGGWYDFTGLIDEPTLYNRALSAAEIQALVNAADQGKCQSLTWTGSADGNWHNASNWNPAAVPTAAADLIIPATGVTNEPTLSSADVTVKSLTLATGRTLTVGSGRALTVNGTATLSGTLTGGTFTFNNLTINNAAGVSLGGNATVTGALTLSAGDLNLAAFTLTMPATATTTGSGDVIGTVKRTGFVGGASANTLSFGHPFNTLRFDSGTPPSEVSVNLVKGLTSFGNNAIPRTYTITPTGGSGYSATLCLHYLDAEVGSLNENTLHLWRFNGTQYQMQPDAQTTRDTTNNWVQVSGVTAFSPWVTAPAAPTVSCHYPLSPASAALPASGGSGNFLVQTQEGCAWTAATQASWITLNGGVSGTGLGSVSYSVAPNPQTFTRTATIAVGDQNFTITQATDCPFTLSATSQSFAANGGTGSVTVSGGQGCSWSATTTDGFITVLSSGNGQVTYAVLPNTSLGRRVGSITIAGQSFSVLQGAVFLDVPLSHPQYLEIGKLSARGISVGCGGGNFCPDASVTREQMAIFIERSLGVFNPPQPARQRFLDVPPSRGGYPFIEDFAARGITAGCGGGNFCPDQEVTRGPMAVFLIRALGVFNPSTAVPQRFYDVPATHPFYGFIEEMWVRGITKGCGGGNYCPDQVVNRGTMAVFLVRAFGW